MRSGHAKFWQPSSGTRRSESDRDAITPLICLKRGGHGPSFFMIHGLGGTFLELSHLAQLIRCPGPIYGFRAKGHDDGADPLTTVEEMAAYYAQAIRAVQPQGPYHLCGYSFGGVVAVEVARCLAEQGNNIALLALIESYGCRRAWPLRARVGAWCCRVQSRICKLARQPAGESLAYVLGKLRLALARPMWNLRAAGHAHQASPGPCAHPGLPQRVYEAEKQARDSYEPRFYPGKIIFLKPRITGYGFPPAPALIWRPLARQLEIKDVPGDHRTMITRHADSIAETLCGLLAENTPPHR